MSNKEIVFVNGAYHDNWCWENFINFFIKNGYKCNINNYPEMEDENKYKISMSDYVISLEKTINKMKTKPVIIVHSLGAAVVNRFLLKNSNKVLGVIFIAPTSPINTFVEMLKAQYKCIGKSKSEMFFSGRVDDAEKYLDKFIELPFKVRIQVAKQVFKQNDSISIPCLVLGSYKDKCIPITSVIKAGQFFNVKTIIYNDMCHDMMLDCEWREIAKEILLFMNNLLGKE